MSITHAAVKGHRDRGLASEWNADHVVTDASKPKNNTTFIIAAYNSKDKTRADYVCDSVDDQDQIEAAIAALPASGGRISFLEGDYVISDTVTFEKSNVTLFGLGGSSRIVGTDALNNKEYFKIGNVAAPILNIIFHDILFDGEIPGGFFPEAAIEFINVDSSIISSCMFRWCDNGVKIDANSTTINITSNQFYACAYAMRSYAIVITFESNILRLSGLRLEEAERCVITDNQISGAPGNGIYIFRTTFVIISDNNVENTVGQAGIYLHDQSHSGIINGNIVIGGTNDGIRIETNVDYCVIGNNVVQSNGGVGILLQNNTVDKTIVIGNNSLLNTGANFTDNGTNTEAAHNITA